MHLLRGLGLLSLAVLSQCGRQPVEARKLSSLPAAPVASATPIASSGSSTDVSDDAGRSTAANAVTSAPAFQTVPDSDLPGQRLRHASALTRFFGALRGLDTKTRSSDVIIVQFGDSHTAGDLGTSAVRRALQARFGDGGRGFTAIGKPWSSYSQSDVRTQMSEKFGPAKIRYVGGHFVGDGRYGLGGFGVETKEAGLAKVDLSTPASKVEVSYLEQPSGGTFEVVVDGQAFMKVRSQSVTPVGGHVAIDLPESPHQLTIRAMGDGEVRLFGAAWGRTQHGIVLDSLGINGAQIFTLLRLEPAHWISELAQRKPELVIFAYGTNEGVETFPMTEYEERWRELLLRFRKAAPDAACLLLGPPDLARKRDDGAWHSTPRIEEIDATEDRVAAQAKCAYYSQFTAMGGRDSMARWATLDKPLGGHDRIHLTRDGYDKLGRLFAADLMDQYDRFRGAQKPTPP